MTIGHTAAIPIDKTRYPNGATIRVTGAVNCLGNNWSGANNGGDSAMRELALKVKAHSVTPDEIARLVAYTKEKGGIEYAERRMWEFHGEAQRFLDGKVAQPEVKAALQAYLDFVIKRNK